MRLTLHILSAAFLGLGGISIQAAHTHARLLLAADSVRLSETVWVGIDLKMDPGWHTYWKNSGESGQPTTIDWELPLGVTAESIRWPLPEKLLDQGLATYVYTNEVMLLVPLKLAPDLHAGPLTIKATVQWLECQVACVPGRASVQAVLNIGSETRRSADAPRLDEWQRRLPQSGAALGARARWDGPATGDTRPLTLEWTPAGAGTQGDFLPDNNEAFEVQAPTQNLPAEGAKNRIRKDVKKFSGDWPKEISGVLVDGTGPERKGYEVRLPIAQSGVVALAQPGSVARSSLLRGLLYGFIGGLILNVMPCVLPVIALKILGFVGQAKEDPRRGRYLGLVYGAGVLVSFLVLAGLVLGIKAAGYKAGWGIQFGNPYFLIAMTTLVMLIALNLFGVFEVSLGGRTMDAAASLSSGHGASGAFFNGLLATLLATSCTAPFLGAAVGYAFAPAQTATSTVLVFLAIGLGLAFPYVVLTWQPGWLKFLPKPGPWMERFKVAMGFPMLAAAVWLFSLTSVHYGERSWWLAIFLVIVAVAAWIYGEFVQRHRARPGIALAAIIAVLAGGYAFALESHLRWREPIAQDSSSTSPERTANGIPWQKWSPAAVTAARAKHRPVLVDFTATWCLTCNIYVKPTLESSSVRKKLKEVNAVALLADYTYRSDQITDELERFGRAGVPLVLVYPRNADRPPIILPEVVTPAMVVNALERAAE